MIKIAKCSLFLFKLTVVVLQHVLSDEELRAWGWRIPFALGAVLAIVALYLRRSLN